MRKCRKWTQEEIDYLKEHYGKITAKEITKKLNKNIKQVTYQANKLNFYSKLCFSEKAKRKMSLAGKRKWKNPKYRRKFIKIRKKQLPFTKEIRKKMSKSHIGKYPSKETKEKFRKRLRELWKNPEYYKKQIKYLQNRMGNKNSMWKGGISFIPYSVDWTNTLKKSIRERDKYICQLCSNEGCYVHHIDYNKKNCNPINLITLCHSCHSKTNHNREKWIKDFSLSIK